MNIYADDTIISFSANSIYTINNAVNEDVMLLKTWLYENNLYLNVTKTLSLLIGSSYRIKAFDRPDSNKLSLSIGEELISTVADTKYLGLQVDRYISWDQHVLLIAKKNLQRYRYATICETISPFENCSEDVQKSY